MSLNRPELIIVIPCYNEEKVLPITSEEIGKFLREQITSGRVASSSKILFVDDGSQDRTWEIIEELSATDAIFAGLKLSRNRGHQNALLAGLLDGAKTADVTISIDADLQDDVAAMSDMLEKFEHGCQVVYGVRSERSSDRALKRFTAELYYRLLNALGGEVVFNHADYRLLGRKALDALAKYSETSLYLRGIVPMIGYKADVVYYERAKRAAGESKYTIRKMLKLAWDGITSLSAKPLTLVGWFGLLMYVICMVGVIISVVQRNSMGIVISMLWASTGMILLALGLIAGYIAKIHIETKHRPRYVIEKTVGSI